MPRSFLGPLFISIISSPVVFVFHHFNASKFWTQYIGNQSHLFISSSNCITLFDKHLNFFQSVRLVLTTCVILSWSKLQRVVQRQIGSIFSIWFTLITISQFHFMFYMSRTLPNIFALPLGMKSSCTSPACHTHILNTFL